MAKPFAIKFYQSKQWRSARAEALRRDHYTCCDCYDRATEVHHIIELTAENIHDNSIALNIDNLESLCWHCHDKRTKGCSDVISGYVFDESGQVVPSQRNT